MQYMHRLNDALNAPVLFFARFVRQCLCLLSALVSQGAEAAREIFSLMQFSKGLTNLAHRRDKTVSASQTANFTFSFIHLAKVSYK